MSSPLLWGPNNTSNNLQNQIQLANGSLINSNGPQNLITYSSFINGQTTGWSLGTVGSLTNGIPTGSPTFGSGASGNLSIAATSSSPINGIYSLSYISSAATTQGDMLASDALTVSPEMQAKVLTFKFAYQAVSNATNGNFSGTSSNSFGVACYDVTNSSWLPVAGNFSMTQNNGVGLATGTMQTNATTASVRFVIYNANATSGAITLYFDDFYLGPQTAPIGAVVTDWQSYTPTISWTGSISMFGFWRRVGSNMQVTVLAQFSGVPGNATADPVFGLPPGYSIDTSKMEFSAGAGNPHYSFIPGNGLATASSSAIYNLIPYVTSAATTTFSLGGLQSISTHTGTVYPVDGAVTSTTPFSFVIGATIQGTAEFPIVGWSSNVQMSNDTDTRVVALVLSGSSTSITSSGVAITPSAVSQDTHGGFSGTTYTVPVTGFYRIEGSMAGPSAAYTSGNVLALFVKKNGTGQPYLGLTRITASITNSFLASGAYTLFCNAGDTLQFFGQSDTTGTITGFQAAITRLSGPAVIAATDSVNARYTNTSAQSISSGSSTTVTGWTKDYDSCNAFNASTGLYTAPVSGKYAIKSHLILASASITTTNYFISIIKNGSIVSTNVQWVSSTYTGVKGLIIADSLSLLAGDTVGIQIFQGSGGSRSLSSNAQDNTFSIERVGN